jgi:hypothetical protein
MKRRYLPDAQQALGFAVSQTAYIETQVYQTQYPDIQYPGLIPVDTSANAWAKSVTYYSQDKVGRAAWFHHYAKDIAVADIERTKNEVGIEMANIGYRWTLEELGQAMMIPGTNLAPDRADAAIRAYEEFMDDIALRGKAEKNFNGIMSYPGITVSFASVEAGHTTWDQKSADGMIADVNNAITGIYTESNTVEMADTILLPVAALTIAATKRIPNTMQSVLDYLATKNVYTQITGRPLTIRALRGLETAGQGGSGRMVAYRRDPQVLKMHIPMPHQFLPVMQTAPMVFDVPGIFRVAGLEIRRPKAVRYVDGILTVDQAS